MGEKMNVLVTGATGFIGSRCVRMLLERGAGVAVITRSKARLDPAVSGRVTAVEGDISDGNFPDALDRIAGMRPDACLHLAANLSFYGKQQVMDRVNVIATGKLLGWCLKNSVRRFVFASSIEAAGPVRREECPAREDATPRPVSPYGRSKLAAERMVLAAGMRCQVVRLGNVYGPGSGFLIPAMSTAISGNGLLARARNVWKDFRYNPVFVDDAAGVLASCAMEERGNPGVYNIGGSRVLTLGELHGLVARAIHREAGAWNDSVLLRLFLGVRFRMIRAAGLCDTITYILSGDDDRHDRAVDISRAEKQLGYAPAVSLEEGIQRTLENENNRRQ